MHRFFISSSNIHGEEVIFPEDISHQICRVLRIRLGQRVAIFDERMFEFEVEIVSLSTHEVRGEIRSQKIHPASPLYHLSLYLSITQREKFEWMLQKCCEAGATSFTPFISSRSLVQNEKDIDTKLARWQKILREAAEQCGRRDIPQLNPPLRWPAVIKDGQGHPCKLLAWEKEESVSIHKILTPQFRSIAAVIGPEGGISDEEARQAEEAGFHVVSLGPRILRMETAAVVLTAQVMFILEGF